MARRSIPLYRQILPWAYVIFFLLTAPLLILYTAGYRWNGLKHRLERNSALIVDTSPKGAQIFVDHRDTGETSPITFQNMAPGWHTIRLEKAGYFSWEKNLALQPERVTFATSIPLWKISEPHLVLEQASTSVALTQIENVPSPPSASSTKASFFLLADTSTHAQILVDDRLWRREFSLPGGPWQIWQIKNNFVLLKHDQEWLAVDPSQNPSPLVHQVTGDVPRWLASARQPTALFLQQNELWMWPLDQDPVLLWRQSEPLVQTVWHESGTAIFFATQHDVMALDLDDRGGRIVTSLAHFDQIRELALLNKTLYITGTKDGKTGLWELVVE